MPQPIGNHLLKKFKNINKVDSTSSSTKTKRRFKFNSFSFRPSNKTNLYTWLFGTKRNLMQGRFCQAMDEELGRYYKMEGKTSKKENDSTDESNGKDIGIANSQNYEELIRQKQIDFRAFLEEKREENFDSNYDCDTSTQDEEVENISTKRPKRSDETKDVISEEIIKMIRVEPSVSIIVGHFSMHSLL